MAVFSFLPSGNNDSRTKRPKLGTINRAVTSMLQLLSTTACRYPIRTIWTIAVLSGITYIRMIMENANSGHATVEADWISMVSDGPRLVAGPGTGWEWHRFDTGAFAPETVLENLALMTLVFSESPMEDQYALSSSFLGIIQNLSMVQLSPTPNGLSACARCSTFAFSIKYADGPAFLDAIKAIPHDVPALGHTTIATEERDHKAWILRPAMSPAIKDLAQRLRMGWTDFVDLIDHAARVDIIMVTLGYIAMLRTFVYLFISMKRMGSRVWLATSSLLSSTFAFLFGLNLSLGFGVPISMTAISEGLPFLVAMVGFEKNILLTRAVLSHAVEHRKLQQSKLDTNAGQATKTNRNFSEDVIHYSVKSAIRDTGYSILLNYVIEISLLVAGAALGLQRLQQICILAIFTLFFDSLLLFTLYIAVLCIKVEINRIRRLADMRRALEDDGLSPRIAESVAKSNDPNNGNIRDLIGTGRKTSVVSRLKFLTTTGFMAINVGLVSFNPSAGFPLPTISTWVAPPSFEPFEMAVNGLDQLLSDAKSRGQATLVTVMPPMKYELENCSVDSTAFVSYGSLKTEQATRIRGDVKSLLATPPDKIIYKWTLVALALSMGLNGYLFKTTRLVIKEPQDEDSTEVSSREFSSRQNLRSLVDDQIIDLCLRGEIPGYALERRLKDCNRAVRIRRAVVSRTPVTRELTGLLEHSKLPYNEYDWERVLGACCENVIGYMPVPVGVAGPLVINGRPYFIPMATTEGVLVASTNRGSKAINLGGGVVTALTGDGMTRAPCVSFETLERAGSAKLWLDSEVGQDVIKAAFESTSRYMCLKSIKTTIAGTNLYIRFKATTGDAMGMNMISKGVEHALEVMKTEGFDDMDIITLSSNYCSDKKPSAINWLDGRGKGIVAEAIIPVSAIKEVLKSDIDSMVELGVSKLLIGSAMAGSTGGFNANAANLVAAIFIATGQDPAQVVEGANCITIIKKTRGCLQISVSMPSLEVGTLGGGTILEPQSAMLELLGVRGSHATKPGENARQLAHIIGGAVLALELSLCAALAAGHLVKAHMVHNRSAPASTAPSRNMSPVRGARATDRAVAR